MPIKGISRRKALGTAVAGLALAAGGGALAYTLSGYDSIEEYLADVLPPDASLALVAAKGHVTHYRRGFGLADRKKDFPNSPVIVYDIGSLTKQFTAAAILRLEMDGALTVTDPLSAHLPGTPADKRDITLHQLLTHTAGLKDLPGLGDYDKVSREDLLREFADRELTWKPGGEHHYSNLGYSILAAVIETVTSGSYDEYLVENLFRPADMRQTGYALPSWYGNTVAIQYDNQGRAKGKPHELDWDDDGPYWILRGNGGMLSNCQDMAHWHSALEGEETLSGDAKRKLFEPHVPEDDTGESFYGYGWAIITMDDGSTVAWHDGSNGWSYSLCARNLDDGRMVFFASNAADWDMGDPLELALGVLDLLKD